MGATRDNFIKYPRTPHLFGSKGTDDDKHLGREDSEAFIADPSLIVEEKLDGTNVGIHFTASGRMVLQCRGHEITEGMHPQYDLFKQWTSVKRPILEAMLDGQFILTHQMRQRWINLFADYAARVEIIYIEPPVAAILARNKRRTNPVPENVILRLLEKLEMPTITECHMLTII